MHKTCYNCAVAICVSYLDMQCTLVLSKNITANPCNRLFNFGIDKLWIQVQATSVQRASCLAKWKYYFKSPNTVHKSSYKSFPDHIHDISFITATSSISTAQQPINRMRCSPIQLHDVAPCTHTTYFPANSIAPGVSLIKRQNAARTTEPAPRQYNHIHQPAQHARTESTISLYPAAAQPFSRQLKGSGGPAGAIKRARAQQQRQPRQMKKKKKKESSGGLRFNSRAACGAI